MEISSLLDWVKTLSVPIFTITSVVAALLSAFTTVATFRYSRRIEREVLANSQDLEALTDADAHKELQRVLTTFSEYVGNTSTSVETQREAGSLQTAERQATGE